MRVSGSHKVFFFCIFVCRVWIADRERQSGGTAVTEMEHLFAHGLFCESTVPNQSSVHRTLSKVSFADQKSLAINFQW